MSAPSEAYLSAMARPMPRLAPVTRATLPAKSPIIVALFLIKSFSKIRNLFGEKRAGTKKIFNFVESDAIIPT
jgi:hypothetical protein